MFTRDVRLLVTALEATTAATKGLATRMLLVTVLVLVTAA